MYFIMAFNVQFAYNWLVMFPNKSLHCKTDEAMSS